MRTEITDEDRAQAVAMLFAKAEHDLQLLGNDKYSLGERASRILQGARAQRIETRAYQCAWIIWKHCRAMH
jgi:hypothetical protein